MNHGVLDRHRGGEARCVIVAVNAVQHEWLTILAGVDSLLQLTVTRIVTAHEANLNQLLAGCHLGLNDALAGIRFRCQRLFAENILAGFDCCHNVLLVERVERGNDYCVDIVRRDHVLALFISLDAVFLGNRLAEVDVCVRAGNYLAALQGVVDAFNVGAADCAGTYQTDSEFFHDIFLLNSC